MNSSIKIVALVTNHLNIVTWNANSIIPKLDEFKNFLYANKYDIVGVCETKTDESCNIRIPGYKSYIQNRDRRGGCVAIFVRENIDHSFYKLEGSKNVEFVGVRLTSNANDLYIGQVYKPPNKTLNLSDLEILFCQNNVILMSDLNCKRKEWNCVNNNNSGQILLNFCLENNINISVPYNCTNFPTVGEPSVIDFFLYKGGLNHSLPVTKIRLSSDHNLVETIVSCNYQSVARSKIYNYAKADW